MSKIELTDINSNRITVNSEEIVSMTYKAIGCDTAFENVIITLVGGKTIGVMEDLEEIREKINQV